MENIERYSWHLDQWQQVQRQVQQGRLASAYLLNGQAGLGKFDFAMQLASSLLCEHSRLTAGEPCGKCKQCQLLQGDFHPDLKLCSFEDKSTVIKVDQIREQVSFLEKSSLQGGMKISIIYPADAMNINAANALLKTLEEPTEHSLLILVTNQASRLLPTIRSRCQVLEFSVPERQASLGWLAHSLDEQTPELAAQLLDMSGGAPLLAREMAADDFAEMASQSIKELGAALKREKSICEVAKKWSESDTLRLLQLMLYWQQLLIKFKLAGDESRLIDPYARKMFVFIAGRNESGALFDLYQKTLSDYKALSQGRNPNKQLLLESILIEWIALMP